MPSIPNAEFGRETSRLRGCLELARILIGSNSDACTLRGPLCTRAHFAMWDPSLQIGSKSGPDLVDQDLADKIQEPVFGRCAKCFIINKIYRIQFISLIVNSSVALSRS